MRRLLLISGGLNSAENYPRYAEDCAVVVESLSPYGYESNAVFADGNLQGRAAGQLSSIVSATKQNVVAALTRSAAAARAGDAIVIYVTDHGGVVALPDPYQAMLGLWRDRMSDTEFFAPLQVAKGKNVILIFQQCEAGAFALRHKSLGFEMAGATKFGSSYMARSGQVNIFTDLLFRSIRSGLSLKKAVRQVVAQNYLPEEAWHTKPFHRFSAVLAKR